VGGVGGYKSTVLVLFVLAYVVFPCFKQTSPHTPTRYIRTHAQTNPQSHTYKHDKPIHTQGNKQTQTRTHINIHKHVQPLFRRKLCTRLVNPQKHTHSTQLTRNNQFTEGSACCHVNKKIANKTCESYSKHSQHKTHTQAHTTRNTNTSHEGVSYH